MKGKRGRAEDGARGGGGVGRRVSKVKEESESDEGERS